jgi:LysM repeat protein
MAAKKTPKKFRQARKAAKVDAKKAFSGAKKASLKDPFTKFSKDDIEVLKEMKAEAKKGYITDDKGNKINVKPTETAQERMARDRAAAKAEALRKYPYDKAELEAMSKADRQAAELEQKRISEPRSQKVGKSAPKVTEAGKVRSAVTVNELKPQGKVIGKPGEKKNMPAKKGEGLPKKTPMKPADAKKPGLPTDKKLPLVKKGFAAGKELNAEGKAIYDKLVKEGVKPKSALNKALFRQEKSGSRIKITVDNKPTVSKPSVGAKAINEMGKKKGLKDVMGIEKKPTVKTIKVPSTVVSSKPNVPGKELVVRPKAGPVVTKTAAKKAGAKAAFKTAALGAAKSTGRLFTSKAGLAITAASLLGKPVLQALTKDPQAGKKQSTTTTPAVKSRSNQPRITGQGKYIGRGNIPTISSGGSTSVYKVNAGDTLSGIAKKSGVTLSELMAANKSIKDPRKIYRNTSVKIPSKGKVPTGGYTGPVPYRPKKK